MARITLGLLATLAISVGSGCAEQAPPPVAPGALPGAVVLRVGRVEVKGLRPDTGDRWDPEVAADAGLGCDLLTLGGKVASPVAGDVAKLLCGLAVRPANLEKQPSNPDLQLRLSSPEGASYQSFVVPDALSFNFDYELVVPTAAIPAQGILFEVLDADAEQEPEPIASFRLTQSDVLRITKTGTGMADFANGAATRFEVAATPYVPTKIDRTQLEAQAGPTLAHARPLQAGEVVSLKGQGQYTVGSFYDAVIGPDGYPQGQLHNFNFEQQPFTTAPHACGLALVGSRGRVDGAVIGSGSRFLVTTAGPLRVGINDKDPGNDRGWVAFEGETRAPTVVEWRTALVAE